MSNVFDQLAVHAATPFERATLLPPEAYTSPAVLHAERSAIFASEWICVARTADVPRRGDFVTAWVPSPDHDALLSVAVVRGDDGVVRAFANVCPHRCATLLEGSGAVPRITCPYHAWVFRLDGQCVAAPYMHRTTEADGTPFDTGNHRLAQLAVEIWQGFVYVSAAAAPSRLGPRLTGLAEVVGRYRMADYVPVAAGDEQWDTNWKCLAENFMDAYHVFKVHRATFAKDSDSTGSTTVPAGTDAFAYHVAVDSPSSPYGVAHADNDVLEGEWRHSTVLAAVFPNHVMQLQPDWLWYLVLSPVAVGRVHIHWSVSVAPEHWAGLHDQRGYVDGLLELLATVNGEDRPIVEGVWRGLQRGDAPSGPLSFLERNVHDFDRHVSTRLAAR